MPFSKRDWILITDFENLTNDPVFDKSLFAALTLSTSQSRYINIFPKSNMLEALERMKLKDQTSVDEKTGREIAIREGIKLCLVPGISEVGNRYALTAKILEAQSGNILNSEIVYAETKNQILPGLDRLSKKIRRNLGESRYDIVVQDKPLAKVTTSSLEALKQYSIGFENHIKRDFTKAKEHYEMALQFDTGFIAAYASLGTINIERFDAEKGRELLDRAVQNVDKLTARERLSILSNHSALVEKDLPKSIQYLHSMIDLYPDDPVPHNNLANIYYKEKRYEEALKEAKTVVRINPKIILTYGMIPWIFLEGIVKIDSALYWSDKLINDNPQNAWGYLYRGLACVSKDSLEEAERAFIKAREIDDRLLMNLYELAHTYRLQERYEEAIQILEKIPEIDKDEFASFYNLGINYQFLGKLPKARQYFNLYRNQVLEVWLKK